MKFLQSLIIISGLFFATSNIIQAQAIVGSTTTESNIVSTSIKVNGVGCSSDIKSISKNIEAINGVSSCELGKKGATSVFEVHFDPAVASLEAIHAAIEGTPGCKNPNDRPYKVKDKSRQ